MDRRVNFTVSDHEWEKIEILARSQRLKPATFSRSVFVRALASEVARVCGDTSVSGFEQLELFDGKPQLTIKRGKK